MRTAARSSALVALLLLTPLALAGQAKKLKGVEQKKAEYEITRGAWLNVGAGIAYTGYGALESVLARPEALTFEPTGLTGGLPGQTFTMQGLGSSIGLQLGGIIRRRFIVQLAADWKLFGEATTFKGAARVGHAAIGGHVGYAVINRSGWLLYPYVGYLTGEAKLEIENRFTDPILFSDISIGRSRTGIYRATMGLVELGVSTRHALNRSQTVTLGADLGGFFAAGGQAWRDATGAVPANLEAPKLSGVYLRVTLGGALFETDKPLVRRRSAEPTPVDEPAPDLKGLFGDDQKPAEPVAPAQLDVKEDKARPAPVKTDAPKAKTEKPKREKKEKAPKPKKQPKPKKAKDSKDANYDESEFDKKQ